MILVVDDDPSVTASLTLLLKQAGYASQAAGSPGQALSWLARHECRLVLQDMNFSRKTTGEEGLGLIRTIRKAHPDLPVILMTAWGSIPLAVEGMKAGASDFITKPWTNEQLLHAVRTALGLAEATKLPAGRAATATLTREELDSRYDFGDLVGEDPKFLRVLHLVGRVAATDASVLITGDSGTGKELVADAIHRNSASRAGPFVKVNLGGIPPTLFESEMFGHVRGAFTDPRADRKGRFEVGHGGTIFLDEVGDLDQSAQVKLLRVLQDRSCQVLGSSQAARPPRAGTGPRGRHRGRPPRPLPHGHLHGSRLQPELRRPGGTHRGAARGREGSLREADQDALARGEQHSGRLDVAPVVLPELRCADRSRRSRRLRDRPLR
ncbi:MAG: sigma-54-dependent transcriptional regulator [Vicinamibacterales bacterium]